MPDLEGSANCRLQFGGLRLRYRLSGVFAAADSENLKCGVPAFIPFGVFSCFMGNEVADTSQALQATSRGVCFVLLMFPFHSLNRWQVAARKG